MSVLDELQKTVQGKVKFTLEDYFKICYTFFQFTQFSKLTRIVSPSRQNKHYIFYQYGTEYDDKITRPLNSRLFIESPETFSIAFERFIDFLADLKRSQEAVHDLPHTESYIQTREINQVIYTMQQSIGCIGDSFENANQSRKRIGQLFETLIKLIIQKVGLQCEPCVVNIPIPGYPGYKMSYELDVVFSREKAILTSEVEYIHASEIVGSIKTTSKDRIDKIFLDKYLLARLLKRDIPVVAIFLHDVQRAAAKKDLESSGDRFFNINSTFKTNHFLGYTVALNKLDGGLLC